MTYTVYEAMPLDAMLARVQKYTPGDGAELVKRTLSANLILPPEHHRHQRASGVGLAALRQMAQGIPADANSLPPNYLRLSQAERERLERQK